ncbi:hypothetical protein QR680_007160 [Steinernema hermaphroditum]|uniref:G-protein coupled receptors family 1 profile domain-containing protein n=1 Tax=Steinernema hermaphroditum TaxID=289476 RepID=A0AA39I049_9BILA|nr:hypothetical protein QR680_007160 [Steinernema hermaphroditum]
MNNSSDETEAVDHVVAGALMILFGLAGIVINTYVIYAVNKNKNFGLSFGAMCISQLTANLGNSLVFGGFVGPITMIDPSFHLSYIGSRCGQLLILFWNASLFSHLLTTINRLITLYYPFRYENILSAQLTFGLILLVWIISLCQVVPYFYPDCGVIFDEKTFTFGFQLTECGLFTGTYMDFLVSIIAVAVIFTIDFFSYLKIRSIQKSAYQPVPNKDIRFFFQVLTQAVTTTTELFLYFWISLFLRQHKWAYFASKTLAWITVQFVDGLVFIIFNPDLRLCRKKHLRQPIILEYPRKNLEASEGDIEMKPTTRNEESSSPSIARTSVESIQSIDPDDITVHT